MKTFFSFKTIGFNSFGSFVRLLMVSNGIALWIKRCQCPLSINENRLKQNPNNLESTGLAVSRQLILIMSLGKHNERTRKLHQQVILVRGSLLQCGESIFSVIFRYSKCLFVFSSLCIVCSAFNDFKHKRNRTMTTINVFCVVWYSIRYGIVTMILGLRSVNHVKKSRKSIEISLDSDF